MRHGKVGFSAEFNIENRPWTKIHSPRGTGRVHERALMAGADCKLKPAADRNKSSGSFQAVFELRETILPSGQRFYHAVYPAS